MNDAKSKYRKLCRGNPELPLFDQDWWLDIACGGPNNWDVCIVEKGNEIVASLPYYKTRKFGFNLIQMPQLTLTMGIWIRYPSNQKYATRLAYEREIYLEIIDQLPAADYSYHHFSRHITNWSTFYWRGFRQTTRYTYVIDDLSDLDSIYQRFADRVKEEIQLAATRFKVVESDDVEKFYELHRKNFHPKTFPIPYSYETLKALDAALLKHNRRKILFAVDESGQAHSAVYIVWDSGCAYNLLGGANPNLEHGGSHSLLIWHAIQDMSRVAEQFDFYGGMHETIEGFFRSFGAEQKPYFQISKMNGKLFKFAYYMKQAVR
ncbi:GNAT family N-acetyltransferase [Cohnella lupini]|uniref:Acetyltransferase (GNAT) family protein n=1 Tax=Cohnella lupini TaxID=1294267 RepID=A0A3D9ITT8_9BACL|nr:GNAT family N-acetyltransferase [Cohnella lupini]RED65067.1 acetyltransferase (GNAT) family protein [Cohnella lupini]